MCMGAIIWAGIGGVIFGTSLSGLQAAGLTQIDIQAEVISKASRFRKGHIQGGILADETDPLFAEAHRLT